MRRLAVLALAALAAGGCGGGGRAEVAFYELEADLREADGGPIACGAPLPCGGSRYAVVGAADLTGGDIEAARAPAPGIVYLDLTARGADRFERLTRTAARRGHRIALVLDGEVLALARVDRDAFPQGLAADAGVQVVTPRAKEIARRLREG